MKKFSFGLIAFMVAIAAAAFTIPVKKVTKPFNNWYRYTLTDNSGMADPANYVYTDNLSGCGEGEVVCIIEAPGPSGEDEHPDFTYGTNPYDNEEGVLVVSEKD